MTTSHRDAIARLLAPVALALICAIPAVAAAQTAGVDPEAARLLRRMSDYLGGLPRFSLETENTLEAVLVSGQKIQFDGAVKVAVQRPNRLYAERSGDISRPRSTPCGRGPSEGRDSTTRLRHESNAGMES